MNLYSNKKGFVQIFYIFFGMIFSLITINIIFNNPYHETAYLLPVTLLCVTGLFGIFILIGRYENVLEKYYNKILLAFSIIMFLIQIILGNILEFKPAHDLGAIYNGAVDWVKTGTFKNYYDYFEWFPNNIGGMLFLYIFFKISSFVGISDFFIVGVVVNSIISVATMVTVSLICKRIKGVKHGFFALCIFALCPPFYIIGAVFYTDALSMLFPVLFYYLYLKTKDRDNSKKSIVGYILMGVVAAIGMQIKFTVLIGIIAVLIDMLFNCDIKRFINATLCTTIIIFIFSFVVDGIIYSNHIDHDKAQVKNTPYLHWIMMGHHGDGLYNSADYKFTRSFEDPQIRKKAISNELFETIDELKYKGLFNLYSKKASRGFGDGTLGLSDFLDDPHEKNTKLHENVLYKGTSYGKYTHYCTSLQIAIFIFMCFGAYAVTTRNKKSGQVELAPFVSIFGLMLFLMLWETNRRYFSNYIPMIFICAIFSMDDIVSYIKDKFMMVKNNFK